MRQSKKCACTQPFRLANAAALTRLPRTFLYCLSPATGSFDRFAAKYRSDPAWRFFELKTDHDACSNSPRYGCSDPDVSSALERLAGPGKSLSAEPPDAKEFEGLKRAGLARLKDAGNRRSV